ncbi:MAG: pyridoxine 5'-phosphate synthase [Alphaproteobacteria bacterium]|nr:pyridoxine 5'-phosphate synthase [Alphaproteobacteria bacterium]
MPKLRLGINIDHVATVRNARCRDARALPDLLRAAQEAIKGGADGITFHLREDRRHILDADVARLRKHIKKPINLEMAATEEMLAIALAMRPHAVCLVPEKRQEVTTEGGLDAVKGGKKLGRIVNQLAAAGIRVSLFINPEAEQILAAWTSGAAAVEFHTGTYADSKGAAQKRELKRLQWAATQAHKLGLEVHAGHGLNYANTPAIAAIPEIVELNIGHFLVGEALFVGLAASVRQMRGIMNKARKKG